MHCEQIRDLKSSASELAGYLLSTGNCHRCSQNPSVAALMRMCCASRGFVSSLGLAMRALCQLLPGAVQGLAGAGTGQPHTADLGSWL